MSICLIIGKGNCETRTCAIGLYQSTFSKGKLLAFDGHMERSLGELKDIGTIMFTVDVLDPSVVNTVNDLMKHIISEQIKVYIPQDHIAVVNTDQQRQALKGLERTLELHPKVAYKDYRVKGAGIVEVRKSVTGKIWVDQLTIT